MVFTSTMIVQRVSLQTVIDRCNRAGVPVVAGGPHPTTFHDEIRGVDYFVLDEAEETFPQFLRDLEDGAPRKMYREPRKPDVSRTPIPRFDLIDMKSYHSMGVQFSRGCPFDCEFCDITKLYGRVPRTKSPDQMVREFDVLFELGWRGPVFLVDDNFIGNKRDALNLLPALAEWQQARGYPFLLCTEASLNLARMDDLMEAMISAGFDTVFLGIETPNPKALLKTKKPQNTSKEEENFLFQAVRRIQDKGMQVQGGFILGLDGDDESVFDTQIEFIQATGIPVAPIYLLTALKGTDMYKRLEDEGRLLDVAIGTQATILNFRTELDHQVLLEGYRHVTTTLYDPTLENYFERCLTLFEHWKPVPHLHKPKSKNAVFTDLMECADASLRSRSRPSRSLWRRCRESTPACFRRPSGWRHWVTTSKRSPASRSRSMTSRNFWRRNWNRSKRTRPLAPNSRSTSTCGDRDCSRTSMPATGRFRATSVITAMALTPRWTPFAWPSTRRLRSRRACRRPE